MLGVVNELIKKFRINVNQILANSDNTMEDIINESFIVVSDNYEQIKNNDRVFINELRVVYLYVVYLKFYYIILKKYIDKF